MSIELRADLPQPSSSEGLRCLRTAIAPLRERLLGHPIYTAVDTLDGLRHFMASHVFAVWDFMCLAKRLQRDLTCVDALWLPAPHAGLARFINSVVLAEESDLDPEGGAASHFELYAAAMEEVGAATEPVKRFVESLRRGTSVPAALATASAPAGARAFVLDTLRTVEHGTTLEVAAAFLFGREDLIPDMFARLLANWEASRQARRFTYYVKRHVELDGDEHGPAGERALIELAGERGDAWQAASQAAATAMTARVALWDSVLAGLPTTRT